MDWHVAYPLRYVVLVGMRGPCWQAVTRSLPLSRDGSRSWLMGPGGNWLDA